MRPSARFGFTLFEVLVVLVIIAIVAGMAIPKMSTSGFRADASMRTVQAVLQQAQRSAIQRQSDIMVSFDLAGGRVRVVYDANNNHAIDGGEQVNWKPLEEGSLFATPPSAIRGTVASPVAGDNLAVSGEGYPTVYYRRNGSASSTFTVYLRSATDRLTDFRALNVTQATGRVELFRLSGNNKWSRGSY